MPPHFRCGPAVPAQPRLARLRGLAGGAWGLPLAAAAVPPRTRECLHGPGREAAFPAAGGSLLLACLALLVSVSALPTRIAVRGRPWPTGYRAGATFYPEGMYTPRHFSWNDLEQIGSFVDGAQAADLITFDGTRPVATLLPVIWDRPDDPGTGEPGAGELGPGSYGRLLGHIAIANTQWQTAAPGAEALAIVHGPQAYVSPAWYESKARHGRVVPTWNYETVHLTGTVTFHQDHLALPARRWLRLDGVRSPFHPVSSRPHCTYRHYR